MTDVTTNSTGTTKTLAVLPHLIDLTLPERMVIRIPKTKIKLICGENEFLYNLEVCYPIQKLLSTKRTKEPGGILVQTNIELLHGSNNVNIKYFPVTISELLLQVYHNLFPDRNPRYILALKPGRR